jgi:hypothetical protein
MQLEIDDPLRIGVSAYRRIGVSAYRRESEPANGRTRLANSDQAEI